VDLTEEHHDKMTSRFAVFESVVTDYMNYMDPSYLEYGRSQYTNKHNKQAIAEQTYDTIHLILCK
jgi:hypothetical protein